MPLPRSTAHGTRHATLARAATIATAACLAAGATTVAGQAAPRTAEISRYDDIEANKAASMRALGRHRMEQRATPASRYQDLEANKARSLRGR